MSRLPRDDVEAVVHPVHEVDVGEPSVLEHPPVANGAASERVARAVGGAVVSLHLDQTAAKDRPIVELAA
jgi:hypothetical protein